MQSSTVELKLSNRHTHVRKTVGKGKQSVTECLFKNSIDYKNFAY